MVDPKVEDKLEESKNLELILDASTSILANK